jgi:hypothetical protein
MSAPTASQSYLGTVPPQAILIKASSPAVIHIVTCDTTVGCHSVTEHFPHTKQEARQGSDQFIADSEVLSVIPADLPPDGHQIYILLVNLSHLSVDLFFKSFHGGCA